MLHTFDIPQFRAEFPPFSDSTAYPDATLTVYWNKACVILDPNDSPSLNGGAKQEALNLLTAHILTMDSEPDSTDISSASTAGGAGGVMIEAHVDKVGITNAKPPFTNDLNYWLEQSVYGQQYLALKRAKSSAGMYLGAHPERMGFRKIGGVF